MTRLIFKVYHSKAPKHVSTGCFMCEKNYVLLLRFKLTCSIHYYFSSELCVCVKRLQQTFLAKPR